MNNERNRTWTILVVATVLAVFSQGLWAAGADDAIGIRYTPLAALAAGEGEAEPDLLTDALVGGSLKLNIRGRVEFVDQDGLQNSDAVTVRTRIGYGTLPFNGFSGYIELEDIRAADSGSYNAAGLNGQPGKAVIADPEDSEVNQAYVKYVGGEQFPFPVTIIGGRQIISLDDQRFVGAVPWRQNEQTFDAVVVKVVPIEGLNVLYGYIADVNTIFGPDANRDLRSDSHLINAAYACPGGTLVVFGYFLDFSNSAATSVDTYGVRWVGKHKVNEDTSLGYILSYAKQEDAGSNPTNYDADYYLLEGTVTHKNVTGGVGFEVLGSDNSKAAFITPLGTNHKFNGWADVFNVAAPTPAGGLEDLYVFVGAPLPGGFKGKVAFHWFHGDDSGGKLGNELNIVATKAINAHLAFLAKFAMYDGKGMLADRTKLWFSLELKN